MDVLRNEGIIQGQPGLANVGDYATSERESCIGEAVLMGVEGFAQIMEHLMQAAGPQGPLPATDAVIEGLPRVKLDADAIGELWLTQPFTQADCQKRALSKTVPCVRMITSLVMRSCESHASTCSWMLWERR
jgi:hypothetical protein